MSKKDSAESVIHIPPFFYIHVLDKRTSLTDLRTGPLTYRVQEYQQVVVGPERMISIPPGNFCIIENPVKRDASGNVSFNITGQAELLHADQEIRLSSVPFALYPGEVLKKGITPLTVVTANTALRLRALVDFEEEQKSARKGEEGNGERKGDGTVDGKNGSNKKEKGKEKEGKRDEGKGEKRGQGIIKRTAGDVWLFEGPGAYIPRKEVAVDETIKAILLKPNQAIKLRAQIECIDREGNQRVAGEEWLVKKTGAYLPGAYEEVLDVVNAYVLTEKKALHMRCLGTFKDDFGIVRKNGEEWLIKISDTLTYIPDVYEELVCVVEITKLTSRQYCVVLDPVNDSGKPQLGRKKLIQGETSFFLKPGEQLENGIQNIYVLGEQECLILRALEKYFDRSFGQRQPGESWMIRGPMNFVPPVEVEVVCKRHAIPLGNNEGIYVRNTRTGKIRAVSNAIYFLDWYEELWEKDLPPSVEEILLTDNDHLRNRCDLSLASSSKSRDKTRVVTFGVPCNGIVQLCDCMEKKNRFVFGPNLVMLGPHEQFIPLSLSGGTPKKPNIIKSLCLLLGPDRFTDIISVETADHVRLSIKMSYNWQFDTNFKTEATANAIFSIADFVGDVCSAIGSRVRNAVAKVEVDVFHENLEEIIRKSVFGIDMLGAIKKNFVFQRNNLVITRVDIQSVEYLDQQMRDAMQMLVAKRLEQKTKVPGQEKVSKRIRLA